MYRRANVQLEMLYPLYESADNTPFQEVNLLSYIEGEFPMKMDLKAPW